MNIAFIGGALGYGSPREETFHGPDELKKAGITDRVMDSHWRTTVVSELTEKPVSGKEAAFPYVYDVNKRLSQETASALREGHFPCTVGGDHSLAMGTWSGVISELEAEGEFGLMWIDAHMDSHTPLTTPSQAIHGMPLAALLGYGRDEFTKLASDRPKLSPEHVVLMGARSYEEGEEALLKTLGVRIYYDTEIKERGFDVCFQEALQILKNGTKGFGISFDLDAYDPMIAPGVGSSEANGLREAEVLDAIESVAHDPHMKAFELVEFNPRLDEDKMTLNLALRTLERVFQKTEK